MRLIDFLSGEERTQLMVRFDDPSFPFYVESLLGKEVDPVKHGWWIDVNGDGSLWQCSLCGEQSCCKGNYCMDCGAKNEVED